MAVVVSLKKEAMKVDRCLLVHLQDGVIRTVIYVWGYCEPRTYSRLVIDFERETLMEVLHFLQIIFGIEKETINTLF